MLVGTPAPPSDSMSDGVDYLVDRLLEPASSSDGPQVFTVAYANPGRASTRVHFHSVDQFQVVLRGVGAIGRHDVSPFTVHYADAYTPYGPIRDGGGLTYLTVRARRDRGVQYMPESRESLGRCTERRNLTGRLEPAGTLQREIVLQTGSDNPRADCQRLRVGESGVLDPTHGPRVLVVLEGRVELQGVELGQNCVAYLAVDEPTPSLAAMQASTVLSLCFHARNRVEA